jgi:hypothetical protein
MHLASYLCFKISRSSNKSEIGFTQPKPNVHWQTNSKPNFHWRIKSKLIFHWQLIFVRLTSLRQSIFQSLSDLRACDICLCPARKPATIHSQFCPVLTPAAICPALTHAVTLLSSFVRFLYLRQFVRLVSLRQFISSFVRLVSLRQFYLHLCPARNPATILSSSLSGSQTCDNLSASLTGSQACDNICLSLPGLMPAAIYLSSLVRLLRLRQSFFPALSKFLHLRRFIIPVLSRFLHLRQFTFQLLSVSYTYIQFCPCCYTFDDLSFRSKHPPRRRSFYLLV